MVVKDLAIIYDFDMSGIGERVKFLRQQCKLSQAELGYRAQRNRKKPINKDTINKIEHGCNTTIETLYDIANALGVKIGALIPEDQREPANNADPLCPDDNPKHIFYCKKLEEVLHNPRIDVRDAVIYGLNGAYNEITPPENKKISVADHGLYSNDRRQRER